jgi:hypothetical protein
MAPALPEAAAHELGREGAPVQAAQAGEGGGKQGLGLMSRLVDRTVDWLVAAEAEERRKADMAARGESPPPAPPGSAVGPLSITLLLASSAAMLGVGFRVGMINEISKHSDGAAASGLRDRLSARMLGWMGASPEQIAAQPGPEEGSLRERVLRQQGLLQPQPGPQPLPPDGTRFTVPRNLSQRGRLQTPNQGPSAPPTLLAAKALGYATVLTVSSATALCVLGTWYFNITSTEDLIWRLKRTVPRGSDSIKGVVGGPLESFRDAMQGVFAHFRPWIAPKGENRGDIDRLHAKDAEALKRLGIDADQVLAPMPSPTK